MPATILVPCFWPMMCDGYMGHDQKFLKGVCIYIDIHIYINIYRHTLNRVYMGSLLKGHSDVHMDFPSQRDNW